MAPSSFEHEYTHSHSGQNLEGPIALLFAVASLGSREPARAHTHLHAHLHTLQGLSHRVREASNRLGFVLFALRTSVRIYRAWACEYLEGRYHSRFESTCGTPFGVLPHWAVLHLISLALRSSSALDDWPALHCPSMNLCGFAEHGSLGSQNITT